MKTKTVKILLHTMLIALFAVAATAIVMLIFKSKQADDTYLYRATGVVSDINLNKKEITLTDIQYSDDKKLDRLILTVDNVDIYGSSEEKIVLNDIQEKHKLKFYYFDNEEYLLEENAKMKPNSIYDLSK